jgi:AAHS family benzoate transporter-like MFS transporter
VGEKRYDGTENFVVAEDGKRSGNWFATCWNSDFRMRTTLIWTAFACNSFVLYMFTNYLRVLLESAGQSSEVGSQGLSLFSLGAAFGSIGGAFMIGWFGSKWVGTGLAFMGAVATLILGSLLVVDVTSSFNILTLCLLAGASVNGMQAFMYAVSAHSYPTEIRGSAVGMAQTFSRLGAVMSPSAASIYFAMDPLPPASAFFMFVAGTMMLTVVSFFMIPTHIPKNKA